MFDVPGLTFDGRLKESDPSVSLAVRIFCVVKAGADTANVSDVLPGTSKNPGGVTACTVVCPMPTGVKISGDCDWIPLNVNGLPVIVPTDGCEDVTINCGALNPARKLSVVCDTFPVPSMLKNMGEIPVDGDCVVVRYWPSALIVLNPEGDPVVRPMPHLSSVTVVLPSLKVGAVAVSVTVPWLSRACR